MSIWKSIFGPGQNEIWSGIASELNAEFSSSGWLQRGRIDLIRKNIIISLDTYTVSSGKTSVTYTRMRSTFENKSGLEMKIYRKNIFSWIGKLFGMQNISIGDNKFDDEYILQGNPENDIIKIFNDNSMKSLIRYQQDICFEIKKDNRWFIKKYPSGIEELYFQCNGVIKDEKRLKMLFELFIVTIDRLKKYNPGCNFSLNILPK